MTKDDDDNNRSTTKRIVIMKEMTTVMTAVGPQTMKIPTVMRTSPIMMNCLKFRGTCVEKRYQDVLTTVKELTADGKTVQ